MTEITVSVSLPFALRVGSIPYSIHTEEAKWSLSVQRVQKRPSDPRLAASGDLDLVVDRHGLASYSRVTGQSIWGSTTSHAIRSFLDALNVLIENFRDEYGVFWVRRLEIEDLFEVEVSDLRGGELIAGAGRTGGFTPPNLGLRDAAHTQLQLTLERNCRPPVWRQIELDAEDALALGRYEEAVLLAWSALESGCRHALPGLAWRQEFSVRELEERLQLSSAEKTPRLIARGSRRTLVRIELAPCCCRPFPPRNIRPRVAYVRGGRRLPSSKPRHSLRRATSSPLGHTCCHFLPVRSQESRSHGMLHHRHPTLLGEITLEICVRKCASF